MITNGGIASCVQVARVREKSNIHPMNPTQSDTPRTDALESCVKQYAVPQLELLLHARKLEHDLARVTNERREYWRERLVADGVLVPVEQLARVTAEVAELETEHKRVHAFLDEVGVSTGPTEGVSARVSGACAFVRKCLAEAEQANAGRRENGRRADRAEQRVAELEKGLATMTENWVTETRNASESSVRVQDVEQRNTELVAALREAYPLAIAWVAHWTSSPSYGNGVADLSQSEAITRIVAAIARADSATCQKATNTSKISSESAAPAQEPCGGRCGDPYCNLSTEGELMSTPAKHPDTERLVTLLESALKSFAAMPEANPSHTRDGIWAPWTDGCNTLRDAIAAARKQGGSVHD